MSYIHRFDKVRINAMRNVNIRDAKEMLAIVVKAGYNPKTATCKIPHSMYCFRYKTFKPRTTIIHAHDPFDICKLGDKVSVTRCNKMSSSKAYYIKKIFEMAPRMNVSIKHYTHYEKQALLQNEKLRNTSNLTLINFFDSEEKYENTIVTGNDTNRNTFGFSYNVKKPKMTEKKISKH